MDIPSILKGPLFVLFGAILGYLLRAVLDIWTHEVKRRQDLATHVMEQIEKTAPSYYLMGNHAHLLSFSLNQYVETKRRLQLVHIDPGSGSLYEILSNQTQDRAKVALFNAGKLYRVITDRFWIEGERYFLPDNWANQAIVDLHNGLMKVLHFDPNILLKYIKAETQEYEFYEKLRAAESDDTLKDLRDAYVQYQEWLLKNDHEVKELVAYARAYSDLFSQQMERLYKDWFERGLWRRPSNDPRKAPEVRKPSSPLLAETRKLIKRSAENRDDERQKQSRLILGEINANSEVPAFHAHLNLGWNYYIGGQYDLAIEEYQKAKSKQLTNPVIYNNLGNAYASKGEYEKAIQMYEEALRLKPKDPDFHPIFHANFGRVWYKQGNYDKAIQCCRQAIDLDPSNFNYHNDLGNAYYASGNCEEAIEAYDEAIALNPLEPVLYSNLAATYDEQGNYEATIRAYKKAIELAPDKDQEAEYFYKIGEIHEKLGYWGKAVYAYEQVLERVDKNSEYAMKLVSAHKQSGKEIQQEVYDKAIEACRNAIQANPNDAIHHYRLGTIYFHKQDYERALYQYDEAVRLDPKEADCYNQLGLTYRHLDRWEMAVRSYRKALSLDSEPATYYHNLGLAYHAMDRYDDALNPLQTAVEKELDDLDVLVAMVEVYAYGSQPNLEKAMKTCQLAMKKGPDSPLPYWTFGNLLFHQGKFTQAAEAYETAYTRNPGEKDQRTLLERLIEAYKKAVEVEPKRPELHFGLGRAFEKAEDYPKARDASQKALNLAHDNLAYQANLHNVLGNVHYKEGTFESAVQVWKQALEIAPAGTLDVALVHNNLGTAYDRLKKTDDALKHYEQAARLAPDNFVVHYNIGSALFRQDHIRRALSEFQEACRLNPKYAPTHYNIGNCYYRMEYTDLAKEKWQKAIKRNSRFAEAFYNLGVLSYNQGDKESAVRHWQQTIIYDGRLVEAHYNLAIVSFEQDDKDGAMQHGQRTLEISSQFEPARQILEAIQQGRSLDLRICDIKEIVQ